MPTDSKSIFSAIDSFAIRSRLEYYIIGTIESREVKPNLYANITLNSSLALPLRISAMEEIEFANKEEKYQLLIIACENEEELELILSMNVGLEQIQITEIKQD
jgi:hypothetical protein